ncbi:MAG: cation transporter [Bacteroidota bacterium]
MKRTTFKIAKMDCPSDEQIIRMKLEGMSTIKKLEFDIPKRNLTVFHLNGYDIILEKLISLNFDTTLSSTESIEDLDFTELHNSERKILWIVLSINFLFFFIEIVTGFISNSMGLVADSLDMLADGIVYGLALIAVGGTIALKKKIAKSAGMFQIILAVFGFIEVIRRFIGLERMPDFLTMIFISIFALIANIICLFLLQKSNSNDAHIQTSMIFTSNDIIINSGVILAGVLVNHFNSAYPDLIIGGIVFVIVARGAYKILLLAR